MKVRLGDLRAILSEARHGRMDTYLRVLEEAPMEGGDSKAHAEGASGDSLDTQVDRYLAQYENDAKKADGEAGDVPGADFDTTSTQMEHIDWRDLVKGVLIEAGEEDKNSQDAEDQAPGADAITGDEDANKLGLDRIDVAKFADDVVRLIQNYDSLLEVRNTLMRRAQNFLAKNYSEEVTNAFEDVLRDDHGLEIGMDKMDVDADRFPAPAADRANGSAEPGPAGGGAP